MIQFERVSLVSCRSTIYSMLKGKIGARLHLGRPRYLLILSTGKISIVGAPSTFLSIEME